MRHTFAISLATIGMLLASSADAATHLFAAQLSGNNEVPPIVSPATGEVRLTLDDVANSLRIEATFSGLLGPTTAAHIHCCAPLGTNVPPATVVPTFPAFPLGVSSGSFDQTFNLLDASFYNPAFVTANGGTVLDARNAFVSALHDQTGYFNIHSSAFPAGEIRGQIGAIPETSTWAMMIAGFGLVGGLARARRPRAHYV